MIEFNEADVEKMLQEIQAEQEGLIGAEEALLGDLIASVQQCSSSITQALASETTGANTDARCLGALESLAGDFAKTETEEKQKAVKSKQKALQGKVAKISKGLRNEFEVDSRWLERQPAENHSKLLEDVIVLHLAETGCIETATMLKDSFGSDVELQKISQMHSVLSAMARNSLEVENSVNRLLGTQRTEAMDKLHFYLQSAKFITLWGQGEATEAVKQGRENLALYRGRFTKEIYQIVGMLALKPNQAEVEKILKQIYQKMREAFLDCCRTLHNIDAKSLLSVCLHAGTLALPRMAKYYRVLEQHITDKEKEKKESTAASLQDEDVSPVEVELDAEMRYHSSIICPISREQVSSENPPVLLKCGHVLLKRSLDKLTKEGDVRCPTCPARSRTRHCITLTI